MDVKSRVKLTSYEELFGDSKTEKKQMAKNAAEAETTMLAPDILMEFPNHPFHVIRDEAMNDLIESVKEYGVLAPIWVIEREKNGFYPQKGHYIVAGHRRRYAAMNAALKEVPVKVLDLTDKEATDYMVYSNIQRPVIYPSELANAFKLQQEQNRREGIKNDETSEQARKRQRYIRLTFLIEGFLQAVDEKKMQITVGYELSFLSFEQQLKLFSYLKLNDMKVSLEQAKTLKKLVKEKPETDFVGNVLLDEIFKGKQEKTIPVKKEETRKPQFEEKQTMEEDTNIPGQTSIEEDFPEYLPDDLKEYKDDVTEKTTDSISSLAEGEYREIKEPEKVATSQTEDAERIHDEAWFVGQYVKMEPHEAEKLFEICHNENSNADRAKAIQKYIAPHGYHCNSCMEYEFQFNGFSVGVRFRIGQEKIHMKYGRLVVELLAVLERQDENTDTLPCDNCVYDKNGCCDYPNTAEDYCVMGDKQIPKKCGGIDELYVREEKVKTEAHTQERKEESKEQEPQNELATAKCILEEQKKLLNDYLEVGGLPEMTVLKQKIMVAALASMVTELENMDSEHEEPEQPELPLLKNNDQRKYWLMKYKDWGLWYRDERIDVNYYKYDFEDGSRLVVTEYPQRHSYWRDDVLDEYYYHLLEKNKKGYKNVYDEAYRHSPDSETYLVDFLKNLQKKGWNLNLEQ